MRFLTDIFISSLASFTILVLKHSRKIDVKNTEQEPDQVSDIRGPLLSVPSVALATAVFVVLFLMQNNTWNRKTTKGP